MGKLTEYFSLINSKTKPKGQEVKHYYFHIDVDKQWNILKKERKETKITQNKEKKKEKGQKEKRKEKSPIGKETVLNCL